MALSVPQFSEVNNYSKQIRVTEAVCMLTHGTGPFQTGMDQMLFTRKGLCWNWSGTVPNESKIGLHPFPPNGRGVTLFCIASEVSELGSGIDRDV